MDMLAAMKETIALAKERHYGKQRNLRTEISYDHFVSMVDRMEAGMAAGDFSEEKQSRWLGYIQGVMAGRGYLTLEEAKEINKKHAGDDNV